MVVPRLLVLGTVGFDSVSTPFGKADHVLGGSASYAAMAASHFVKTGIISAVGPDFNSTQESIFEKRKIDLAGISRLKSNTFSWSAHYGFDVNVAVTDSVDPSILDGFKPLVPVEWKNPSFVMLGNISPHIQNQVLDQLTARPKLSVCDTMNYYIGKEPQAVKSMVRRADIGLMNDAEARQLFDTTNLARAAREILGLDSTYAIIKKGEHGAVLYTQKSHFAVPGYPLENIKDPTGCGDSFAGGFLGYLAKKQKINEKEIRRAMVWGSVLASFNAEDFSFNRLLTVRPNELKGRFREFKEMVRF